MNIQICTVCPHRCSLADNQIGFCRARKNIDGKIASINYGHITALALDPIEKKPLYHYFPGSKILSVGSFGCNLRCSFCQNYEISMSDLNQINTQYISPKELINLSLQYVSAGNIGIAYTYNEPLIGYEYVRDCSVLAHKHNLKNVLVTNGNFCKETVMDLFPLIDAMNIDLKAFNPNFYKNISGDLDTVKQFIKLSARHCHIEITTLIIPGENDSHMEMDFLSSWLASVDPNIPLHLSRFFPRYKMTDKNATDITTIQNLAEIARHKLKYVYLGNC
jgi:pyruvate formate lyase activating enzyme